MRLELTSERADALPVLPVIPHHRICRIEGYNGIGKTLSLRLLEVCAGEQPYRTQQLAWESLRRSIGPMRITITELAAGADEIAWQFDTTAWGSADQNPSDDWFDISIDRAPATLADVRRLLSVHRIGGNEGLVGTLTQQIRRDAALVRRWRARVADGDDAPLLRVLGLVDRAQKTLGQVDEGLYRELARQAAEEAKAAEKVRGELAAAEQRLEQLEQAATLDARLAELAGVGGNLEQELAALDKQSASADAKVETLRRELGDVERRVEQSAAIREKLAAARRLRATRLSRVETVTRALAGLLQEGGIADPGEADEAIAELREQLERLVVRRAAVDAGPRMRSVLDDLRARLERAEREGLASQELLASAGVTLSVAEAREAFAERAEALSHIDETDVGATLTVRIAAGARRLRALEGLAEQQRKVARSRELLQEADEQIDELLETVDEQAADRAERLRTAVREAEDHARRVAASRVALRRRQELLTGGRPADELEAERADLIDRAKSTVDTLADDVTAQRARLAQLRLAKEEAELREREAAARVAQQEGALHDAVAALAHAEEFHWIRYIDRAAVPSEERPVGEQFEQLAQLRRRIERVAARAGDLSRQVGGVAQSLEDLAEQVRDGQAGSDRRSYLPALRASLGRQYSDYFDEHEVRNALLPGATHASINLESMTVDWEELDADGGSRPFEAFSSGEQAFAYTRATLAGLTLDPRASALNRLVALDEFGAFVARDRVEGLIKMLRAHRDRHANDQLLVILPVAEDYEQQLAAAPAKHLRPRLERIVRELRDRRYFTEEFAL